MARPDTDTDTDARAPAQASTAQPKLIVPLGRGSRGKSWWTRWAVERAQAQGREVVVADADRTNPTLSSYFEGVVAPPSADDRDVREWLAGFVEAQIEQRFTAVLDLGGGDLILKRIAREMSLTNFLSQHGIRPVAVHLLGPDADDLAYLRDVETDDLFAPPATIIIFNEALVPMHRTPHAAFTDTVQAHPILARTLERGAKLVWMPRLEPAQDIDTRRLTFAAAEASKIKEGQTPIGPWKRQQIAHWRRAMETAFMPVADWLP